MYGWAKLLTRWI